jgi:iron complex outermembrane receptor protein
MSKPVGAGRVATSDFRLLAKLMVGTALSALVAPGTAFAQDQAQVAETEADDQAIVVTGIRSSLQSALNERRNSDNLIEVIQAEDIGKLPDQNLAEVLENITGIQITREAGVGTAVQIRGTEENRTEINGVSTVGSGAGRGGISFEDLPAALISSLEVTKVPDAETIEGSVGGTINLRTLRPLGLRDRLFSVRLQGEYSDLAGSFLPRISGTVGDNWSTGIGEIGVVLSGSYARSDVSAFRPRVDRDAVVTPDSGRASAESFPFLRIQFLDQDNDNFEYETLNFVGSLEWKPTDNLRFYFDGIYNNQTRAQESTRVQISGVSANGVVDNTTNTAFETIDLGLLDGPNGPVDLGSVEAALTGVIRPNSTGALDPNLRTDTNTGSRETDSRVYRLGGEWESGRLTVRAEGALSTSDTTNSDFSTTLDFINPNHLPVSAASIDNGVPIEFDLRGGTLQFGIAPGLSTTPTTAQLLDPANYALRQVNQSVGIVENREIAGRLDLSYDFTSALPFITSIDVGYRYNETSSLNDSNVRNVGLTNAAAINRPRANLFSDIMVAGPNNFGSADGRRLFIRDFLVIDPALSFSDPAAILASLNAAITQNNAATTGPDIALLTTPTQQVTAFFDITEETHALYGQLNFDGTDLGIPVRGNLGLRWVRTNVSSLGNTQTAGSAAVTPIVRDSSYQFFLPRFNIVIEPTRNVLIRGGISRDINRPDFDDLSTSVSFGTGPNTPVPVGNPDLVPEAVWSFDLSGEWYFAPSAYVSLGFFHKTRTNLFSEVRIDPFPARDANGGLAIDITPPCEQGGIFNPIADRNINNVLNPGTGICVPVVTTVNGEGNTTQTGIEVAFQYDLSRFEDVLGFASGFGFIGNYTYQTTGGSAQNFPSNFRTADGPQGAFTALGLIGVQDRITLPNLSKHSYNATLYYEKYGLSARVRYTWRSSYVSTDSFFFGLPRINAARGQLNASINYDLTENINIGVEGINITGSDANQFCVNNNALLCFQGLTDRRVTAGVSVRF